MYTYFTHIVALYRHSKLVTSHIVVHRIAYWIPTASRLYLFCTQIDKKIYSFVGLCKCDLLIIQWWTAWLWHTWRSRYCQTLLSDLLNFSTVTIYCMASIRTHGCVKLHGYNDHVVLCVFNHRPLYWCQGLLVVNVCTDVSSPHRTLVINKTASQRTWLRSADWFWLSSSILRLLCRKKHI